MIARLLLTAFLFTAAIMIAPAGAMAGAPDYEEIPTSSDTTMDATILETVIDSPTVDQYDGDDPTCEELGDDAAGCGEVLCADGPCDEDGPCEGVNAYDPECLPLCEGDACDEPEIVKGGGDTPKLETRTLGATPPEVTGGGNLPFTGLPIAAAWLIGLGLVGAGAMAHLTGRRRTRR